MRVLHVDTERGWRGGQTQLLHLARGQTGPVAVVVPVGAPLASALDDAGIPVFAVPLRGRRWGTRALARVVADWRPDLVVAQTSHAVVHADRLGTPFVAHRRLDFVPSRRGRHRLARARGIVAVSHGVAAVLGGRGIDLATVRVVHDGVAPCAPRAGTRPRSVLGIDAGTPLVIAVGALVPHKGHRVLVEAMSRLPGVHVAILGEGPLAGRLGAQARRAGVGDRLHLVGRRGDVGDWIAHATVMCHPSVEEGLGQVVVEALRGGAAVVASRVGGIPEVVEDLGVLVPPGVVDPLVGALAATLHDPRPWRERARSAAPALARRFDVSTMVMSTEAAYAAFLR